MVGGQYGFLYNPHIMLKQTAFPFTFALVSSHNQEVSTVRTLRILLLKMM